jgi:hypothetical protein
VIVLEDCLVVRPCLVRLVESLACGLSHVASLQKGE